MQNSSQLPALSALEATIPLDHKIRALRKLADAELPTITPSQSPGPIPLHQFLRAELLRLAYSIHSDRELCDQVHFNILFRWFVDLSEKDLAWAYDTYTDCRGDIRYSKPLNPYLKRVIAEPNWKQITSDFHFKPDIAQCDIISHDRRPIRDDRLFVSIHVAIGWIARGKSLTPSATIQLIKRIGASTLQAYELRGEGFSPIATWRGRNARVDSIFDLISKRTGWRVTFTLRGEQACWDLQELIEALGEAGQISKFYNPQLQLFTANGLDFQGNVDFLLKKYVDLALADSPSSIVDIESSSAGNGNGPSGNDSEVISTKIREDEATLLYAKIAHLEEELAKSIRLGPYLKIILDNRKGMRLLFDFIEESKGAKEYLGENLTSPSKVRWAFAKYCYSKGFIMFDSANRNAINEVNNKNNESKAPRMADGAIGLLFHDGTPVRRGRRSDEAFDFNLTN